MSEYRSASASRRGRRWALTLAVALPPVALLLCALPEATRRGTLAEIRCWILPNLRSMATPGNESCPVRSRQVIARADLGGGGMVPIRDHADLRRVIATAPSPIRLELLAGTRRQWVDVEIQRAERATRLARVAAAAVAVSFLLGIPLFLVWGSSSRAATPLAAFYGCVSVVLVTTLVGQHSGAMTLFALLALVIAPATAIHLSFVFPRERFLSRDVRALLAIPYGFSALLVPVGWVALARDPLLWPAFVSLLIALTASAWAVLATSCGFAMRQTRSALERARSRLVLYGAVGVPLLPTLLLSRGDRELEQVATAYLWSAAVTMPLPIALAIGRHNLFDLEWDARHAIARILHLVFAALVAALFLEVALLAAHVDSPLREPAPLLLLSASIVAATDSLRDGMHGALDALVTPALRRWRRIREELERALSIERDGGEIARLLTEALRAGLPLRSGALLVEMRGRWRVARAFGEPPAPGAAAIALRALGDRSLVHLAESSALQEQGAPLVATGVEAVVAIESGGTRFGLLLLGSLQRRRPLNGMELDFALGLAAQAGIALRNARITEELLAAERHVAAGRVALGLAHDVGKDLGWMRSLVERLPERIGDPERLSRDAARIAELTEGLSGAIERFVREATEGNGPSSGLRRLDEIVDDVTLRLERLHGCGRVVENVDPSLHTVGVHESLGRAIGNLLDNALHASAKGAPVRLSACREGGCLQVVVEDAGCGIDARELARVFEPGFTTRAGAGGMGVGLPVALQIVEALGGTLELCSGPRGTRATLRVPAAR